MTEPDLHPNLARLAVAYDDIVLRHSRGQLSAADARTEIAQLEARDDAGIRWSLDPETGQWLRRTASGDLVFDPNPPTYGYRTADAFSWQGETPRSEEHTSELQSP